MNRRRLLTILLVLLVSAVSYAFWASPRPERLSASEIHYSQQRGGKPPVAGHPDGGQPVRLDLLRRDPEEFPKAEKDLFGPLYQVKSPSPPPPPPPPPPPSPVVESPPVQTFSPPPEPPPAPLPRFSFRGFLQKEGNKTVFLASGEEVFVVREGERFGKKEEYQVAELTDQRLVIRQSGDPRPVTVLLQEPGGGGGVGSMGSSGGGFRGGTAALPGGFRQSPGFNPGSRPDLPRYEPDDEVPTPPETEQDQVPEPEQEQKQSTFVSPSQLGTPGLLRPLGSGGEGDEMKQSMEEPSAPENGNMPAQEEFR